ncbi:hypothetical protein [Psychroflexus sp. MES1-P1E]|jgi:hypothetical protein|uniref:hypothetical protein n=1 Tax=Psychroflexus sp. MES1-P1E TaxID=2058320 RepID=UPI000C7CBDF9|nr:hypothetical protein [Psychroflexus sp. MES1-P1E]PKG42809.1 hypothetical protein CXF67_08305 [Psychroflexus sp. MES1-P1E]
MRYYYLTIILILLFVSCQNSISDKVEFICENGNKKITIEIENGMDFLTYNKPSKTNFVVTNIDPVNLRIAGPGITILGTNKDKTAMQTEIKVTTNYLENDTLNIKVWYDNEDSQKVCEFKIPVNKAE